MTSENVSFIEINSKSNIPKQARRYSVSERQSHLESWQKSGLTMNKYCRQSDISLASFKQWLKKCNIPSEIGLEINKAVTPSSPRWAELILTNGLRLRIFDLSNISEIICLVKELETCN